MAYNPRNWRDSASGRTPVKAQFLNNLETGLQAAAAKADTAADQLATLQAYAGGVNHTAVMVNSQPITQAGDGWSTFIPFSLNANPNGQIIREGSNNLFRINTPGMYLWAVTAAAQATPSGTFFIDHYRYTSNAGDGVEILSRTSGYHTNWVNGSSVLSLGGTGSFYNLGIRVVGGFTIPRGRLTMTITRIA